MKGFGYLAAFLGGAVAGAAIGLLVAPEKGADTRVKVGSAIDEFMKKHNIKLTHKEMEDLVDDVKEAVEDDF
ncbi:MAG: YtxH domain-containing protein [Prevotellaceae bacterium]|nr:YtxH domain-containing protein [Prevotellaceae bacterium]